MDLPPTARETRGKSAEFDGRRINAVPPMHLGESMLQNLWKEHQQQQQAVASGQPIPPPMTQPPPPALHGVHDQQKLSKGSSGSGSMSNDENDRKLQQMLEKYQSQVKLQQQRNPATSQQKTPSRNNLHKIEKVATCRGPSSGGAAAPQGRTMSHSQPCLIAITDRPPEYTPLPLVNHSYQRRSSGSGEQPTTEMTNNGLQRVANNQKLVNSLREENLHLKREQDTLKKKLGKLQQIESAYERIERDYDTLLREKERQDGLEMSTLAQMEMHLKRIMGEKEVLQDRLEQSAGSLTSFQHAQALEKINQLNIILADLLTQNKELQACKDRQRMEIDAQTATLEEQRNHIAVLDKALSNAQERLSKRERACEELSQAAESAKMLQRQLQETLLDKQQRDEVHSAERAQWEMDITQLKMQLNKDASLTGSLKRSNGARLSVDTGEEAVLRLKKAMYGKDERITQLERAVVELQRRLREECERKSELISLSDNFESKIKKLEEEKIERDRRIADLTEEREKWNDILGESRERGDLYFARERDDDAARSMYKMEEIKQKIQERKRKGRIGVAGGLMGIGIDHSRSSSGSLMTSNAHRAMAGAFDPPFFDPTALPDLSSFGSPLDTNGNGPNGLGGYKTTVAFKGEKRDDDFEPPAWKP